MRLYLDPVVIGSLGLFWIAHWGSGCFSILLSVGTYTFMLQGFSVALVTLPSDGMLYEGYVKVTTARVIKCFSSESS